MQIQTPAKINLTLDVLEKDPATGYHFIESIITEVPEVFDDITITERGDDQVVIMCEHPDVPTDETNLCYKAAQALGIAGITITIVKRIPVGGGFGGGSSNAAGVLKLLNEHFRLYLSHDELRSIGADIGMDVPFFIDGGTAHVSHFGEKVHQLPHLHEKLQAYRFSLVDTGVHVATDSAFASVRPHRSLTTSTQRLLDAAASDGQFALTDFLHNDFDTAKKEDSFLSGSGGGRYKITS